MIAHVPTARDWKQPQAPSLGKWETEVRDMFFTAKLYAMVRNRNSSPQAIERFRSVCSAFHLLNIPIIID